MKSSEVKLKNKDIGLAFLLKEENHESAGLLFFAVGQCCALGCAQETKSCFPSPVLVSTVCMVNTGSWPRIFSAQPMKLHQIIIQSGQMR